MSTSSYKVLIAYAYLLLLLLPYTALHCTTLQAFTTPAAYTLLADAFPESSRATANGIYSSGVYVGGACASLTVLLTASIGWRDCSLLSGSIGIATALLAQVVLREPERSSGEQTVADAVTVSEAVANGAGLAGVTQSLSTVSFLYIDFHTCADMCST
jgi:MFS family permease